MTDKRQIRQAARAARDAFVAAGPRGIAVPGAFAAMLRPGLVVASYVAIGSEADPSPLARAAAAAGCALALPHVVSREAPITFLSWREAATLVTGPFGLRQPAEGTEVSPDLILTPLVAFDPALNRIGQGAGHYDRAFAALPDAARIGVAWSVQQVAAIAADPWDRPLDAIVTEEGWTTR